MLAGEAAKVGFLKSSLKTAAELSSFVRPYFEQCIKAAHAEGGRLDPLALLSSCCFAGAAAARLWSAFDDDMLEIDLFKLVSQRKGSGSLDDAALELAALPADTPQGNRFAACVKGSWCIMALAAWSGRIKERSPEEAILFLQETARVLFDLGEGIVLEEAWEQA